MSVNKRIQELFNESAVHAITPGTLKLLFLQVADVFDGAIEEIGSGQGQGGEMVNTGSASHDYVFLGDMAELLRTCTEKHFTFADPAVYRKLYVEIHKEEQTDAITCCATPSSTGDTDMMLFSTPNFSYQYLRLAYEIVSADNDYCIVKAHLWYGSNPTTVSHTSNMRCIPKADIEGYNLYSSKLNQIFANTLHCYVYGIKR